MLQTIFNFYGYGVFIYFLLLLISYVFLIIMAGRSIFRNKEKVIDDYAFNIISQNPYTPGVSIIVPAYNEAVTIIENVRSFLQQDYPKFEVIVVNDGSTDSSLEKLVKTFDLVKVPYSYVEKLTTHPFKSMYRSKNPVYSKLVVIDKENGGTKADAINCGINVSRFHYFINTDMDCILSRDAALQCMLPIMKDPHVIAVSGIMTMSNGCTIEDGEISKLEPPRRPIPLFQELEYLRSFVVGKMGWSGINAMNNVSGGYGLFNKEICINAGGYSVDSFAEDMDMVMRMTGYCCEAKREYQIVQIPKNCCHTEGPSNVKMLNRQRSRWGTGLIQCFWTHRKKFFNPKYKNMGLITVPYAFFFEFMAPIVEFTGWGVLLYLILTGGINWPAAILVAAAVYLFTVMLSTVVIFYSVASEIEYKNMKQYRTLMLASLLEPFFYHPLITIFNIKGYFEFIIGKKMKWKPIQREGYKKHE
ncbi:glycosyltransferase [Prevotella cerevisiae]|uniref:Glycosyltransferase n=1 Tax=Segatella cerevisiae TaxID=2053716 RepID=A0ABT1BZG8_9BACT|nr:glycosyltransferase [Segatella cerevisiae]MCO6026490.1 glycosyltransferase [Segatella cerevisiae]